MTGAPARPRRDAASVPPSDRRQPPVAPPSDRGQSMVGAPPSDRRQPPVPAAPSDRRRPSAAARRARRRGLVRLSVLVLSLLGAAALVYLLLASPLLGVRSVAVEGTTVLADDDVRRVAAVPAGQPMLRLDDAAVAERVAALAPVVHVRVERSWPSTVVLHLTERTPVAYQPTPAGARLVDATGVFFAVVAAPPPDLPELHALDGSPARAAAEVVAALADPKHQALRAELVSAHADSPNDVRLTLRGERTVRWGGAEESDRKAAVLAVLLSQPGAFYDVASPDLPTIR